MRIVNSYVDALRLTEAIQTIPDVCLPFPGEDSKAMAKVFDLRPPL